ncbi:MAG: PIN domain-containing protein [Candidatus Aminicenantes bacterium]|nr:PIN domain-containing protein [Candidatus Aminicenantes bacterium]
MKEHKVFLDTNIIIYAYDSSAGKKHEVAREILTGLWDSGLGVISTQVLQEFFINVTKKIPKPIDIDLAKGIIGDFLKWDVVVNDGESLLDAIDILVEYNYSFWDSMIIQAAVKGGAELLLTEDLEDGKVVKGVKIRNPYK